MTTLAPPLPDPKPNGLTVLAAMSDAEFEIVSPYLAAAMLGKRIVHPGGRFSTRRVLAAAQLEPGLEVLEVGCGVATTARKIAARGCKVSAIDLDSNMLSVARHRIEKQKERIQLHQANVEDLPFDDNRFPRVIVESVTMFTHIPTALAEIFRVAKAGARIVDHEFCWAQAPSPRQSHLFARDFGTGLCETADFWVDAY